MNLLYWTGWLIFRLLSRLIFRFKIIDSDNVPKEGPFILACNHKALVDPPFVGSNSLRLVHFMAKKELFRNKIFGGIIRRTKAHPISRGIFDRRAVATALEILRTGDGLVIFPEGTRALKTDFLPAKPGIGMVAIQAKTAVIPTYIHGSNRLRDAFWGKLKPGIIYGRPINPEEIGQYQENKEEYRRLAEEIMSRIRELKKEFINRVGK